MPDVTRQMQGAAEAAAKAALEQALTEQLQKANGNLRACAIDARKRGHHMMTMHAADAIVNLVEMCDMVDKNVLAMVFNRLKQNDRMYAE